MERLKAIVTVDRSRAPWNNSRLLSHNMTLEHESFEGSYPEGDCLRIKEIGGDFSITVDMYDLELQEIGYVQELRNKIDELEDKLGTLQDQWDNAITAGRDEEDSREDREHKLELENGRLIELSTSGLGWL